eukprot:151379_1
MIEFPTLMGLEPLTALWPCIVIALILTVYRISLDKLFGSIAKYHAQRQIENNRPQWLSTLLSNNNTNNGFTNINNPQQFDELCKNKDLSQLYKLLVPIGINLSRSQHCALKTYHKACNEFAIKTDKFLESIFKVTVVSMIAIYGFYVVNIKHDLFMNHRHQWPSYPDAEPYRQKTDSYLLLYYNLSLGYHMQRTFLQFHNPTRKDFIALLIHHWSTIILILFSYLASFLRTGSLVLFLHENSDIFLESAKVCSYCDFNIGKELFFALFVISWFIMRIYAFSYKILYEIIRFGWKQLWIGNSPLFFNWTCVILLFVLEALHIYWSSMIISMLIRKLKGKTLQDIRSDEESDSKDD